MTEQQKVIVRRMARVTFPIASYDKRFYRNLAESLDLTDKQAAYLLKLDHRYRRQTVGHVCGELCATYGRRKTAECFEAPIQRTPTRQTKADAQFLRSLRIAPDDEPALPFEADDHGNISVPLDLNRWSR